MSSPISSVSSASSNAATTTVNDGDAELLSKDAFLKLLITQMQNQDPLEPMDNSQTIAQMAQLATMESINNLNDQFTINAGLQSMSTALGMVGKQVTYTNADKASVTGIVDKVSMESGVFYLEVDGTSVELGDVTSISEAPVAEE